MNLDKITNYFLRNNQTGEIFPTEGEAPAVSDLATLEDLIGEAEEDGAVFEKVEWDWFEARGLGQKETTILFTCLHDGCESQTCHWPETYCETHGY